MSSVNAADDIKIPRTQAYSEHLARGFQQLRLDDELTNFTIHTSTRSFRCHQAILAAVSPVLKAMLRSAMLETAKQEVRLENISADVMEILLTYIYTGEVVIPQEQLLPAVEASDYLQLLELRELCLSEALEVSNASHALSMFKLAEKLDIDALKSKCADLIASSLAEISKFEEFHKLHSTELSNILSSAQQSDADPDDLLEATLDWIEYKPDERITSMENLMQKIDILECTLECLELEIEKHEKLLTNCPKVHIMFTKGVVQVAKKKSPRRKYRSRRGGITKTILLGGHEGGSMNKLCWELSEEKFVELCKIPEQSPNFAVCGTPTGFAVTGHGGENCQLCSVFHMTTTKWESLQSLKHPRYAHGSAYMDGKIMVLGGAVSGSVSASVEYLEMDGWEWIDGPNIPSAVQYPEVASSDSGVFLLDTYSSQQLFLLDMGTKMWSRRASIPSRCLGTRMVRMDDQLLVAGGTDRYSSSTRVLAFYSITTDTWTTGNPPPLNHHFAGMFYDNRKLYLMGGLNEDRVEGYNMDTESWSVSDVRVPKKLVFLRALVLHI